MNNFDVGEKKYQILIGVILFIFFLLIVHAFQIMPTDVSKIAINDTLDVPNDNAKVELSNQEEQTLEFPEDNDNSEQDENIEKNLSLNKEVKESELFTVIDDDLDIANINSKDQTDSVISPDKNSVIESDSEEIYLKLFNADKFLKDNQLDKAISEYNSIVDITSDSYIKLRCYEGIANVYAKYKKYGSAIVYAQKAYNIEPSVSLDVLLSRLYYQTGDVDNAMKRITYVLKKEFK